jgi:hypothetical protein
MVSWGFADPLDRDAVFSLLVSRLGYLLFQTVSDVFHVSPWNLEAMPVRLKNLRKFWASSAKSAKRLNEFLEKNPESHTWRNMKGMWSEGLDTRTAHHLSDAVVQDLLSDLGMEGRWPEFEAAYWRSMKVTGEAGHTKRGLLPPKVD